MFPQAAVRFCLLFHVSKTKQKKKDLLFASLLILSFIFYTELFTRTCCFSKIKGKRMRSLEMAPSWPKPTTTLCLVRLEMPVADLDN